MRKCAGEEVKCGSFLQNAGELETMSAYTAQKKQKSYCDFDVCANKGNNGSVSKGNIEDRASDQGKQLGYANTPTQNTCSRQINLP